MDTVLYTVLGIQEAQTDTVLYTVWGSERVKTAKVYCKSGLNYTLAEKEKHKNSIRREVVTVYWVFCAPIQSLVSAWFRAYEKLHG